MINKSNLTPLVAAGLGVLGMVEIEMTNENENVSDPFGSDVVKRWMESRRMKHIKSYVLALVVLLSACGTTAQNPSISSPAQNRLAIAESMFQERCKTTGEKIYRTAENVKGLSLIKVRPGKENPSDQFALYDPYGHDSTGEEYVKSFLAGRNSNGYLTFSATPARFGYQYVEALDPKDSKRYSYTGSIKVVGKQDATAYNIQAALKHNPNYDLNIYAFVLDKTLATGEPPRYGVTYDDISTREEREYWIAGSSLKVIDLKTNEIMAERIGYMMDLGQGDIGGGRSPWLLAADHACPRFPTNANHTDQVGQSRNFVEKVLKPTQEK